MSYSVDLCDPVTKRPIVLDHKHFICGGTYDSQGTDDLQLYITYNYSGVLEQVLPGGLTTLHNRTALETLPMLVHAITNLKDDVDPDYWQPTEGNVKQALIILHTYALMRLDGVWCVN